LRFGSARRDYSAEASRTRLETADRRHDAPVTNVQILPNDRVTPLFQATAQATEAAITNALLAAETTTGANDLRVYAMPVARMFAAVKKYGRLS
jgi:L-aminopeptidase/D-esterase-like protein